MNKADNENEASNIERLAYAGIILNKFYANGGTKSLYSGCLERSLYGNPNLMTTYFERNGYNVTSISIKDYINVGALYRQIINAISSDTEPFFITIDFGNLGVDSEKPKNQFYYLF